MHLGNRETCVVGYDHNARALEDLAEFVDHFLFLGSIHSFTPLWAGCPARLSFAGSSQRLGPYYGTANRPRAHALGQSGVIPSRAGISGDFAPTHRLGRIRLDEKNRASRAR
ncbi:hypothetical protein AIOL_001080 [Candidatus Rhodobacter oscarellae]|uniref:Uncharacterized protein n=1 Tax=Candidatus Rhodobacter oscarellae TaxID=1675527 RepID=A0A0J9GRN0_9RHOB|nr:hypothetical protein AIOL_001080 [Candidatus Rhodobacter lobularis]